MRIVVFGLSITSSWGNGHATLWRALSRALIRRGHRVTFFERDVPYYAAARDFLEGLEPEVVLYDHWENARDRAARAVAASDAAIVTSFCPDGAAAADLILDARGPMRVFYDLDTPVTLAALEAGAWPDYLPAHSSQGALAGFDLVLSYTGGQALTQLRVQLGAARVMPLYGCVDPDAHRPVPPTPEYRADLSYLGTYAADRQPMLERLFVDPARQSPGRRFLIGGALYPADFPWSTNIFFVRHMPPPMHPAFFSSCRLTLNVTRRAMAAMGWCPSGRLFEAAACGAPILTDTWDGLDAFYTPGAEIFVARSAAESLAAIGLDDAELRRAARRARERTLDEHTADRRAREFEYALEGIAQPVATGS
jgi:spore maturation protein CgeB